MPRWNELPSSLDDRVRQLIVQLRRLKDRSGLGLSSLQSKTGYSRSSWERYLNGKALPPRRAVEELARTAGTDATRLLVLHERAAQAWQSQTGERIDAALPDSAADPADGREEPGGSAGRQPAPAGAAQPPGVRGTVAVGGAVAAALVGLGVGMLIAAPLGEGEDGDAGAGDRVTTAARSPQPSGSTSPVPEKQRRYVFTLGTSYPCNVGRVRAAGGALGAGYSATRTAVLAGPGWDVVEAQCLLRHHKLDPGVVDGVYGQQTIAAVARLQKKAGLPADGIVGPHTWRVLRG